MLDLLPVPHLGRGGAGEKGRGSQRGHRSAVTHSPEMGQLAGRAMLVGPGDSDLVDSPVLALSDLGLGCPLGPVSRQKSGAHSA